MAQPEHSEHTDFTARPGEDAHPHSPEIVRVVSGFKTAHGLPTARSGLQGAGTMAGVGWQPPSPSAVDAEFEADGEFISSTPPAGRVHGPGGRGGAPADPAMHARTANAGSEIAIVEPSYTSPPLPPWLHVHDATNVHQVAADVVMLRSPNSPAAQQFRTMRYRVEQEAQAQIVAVISARHGEGKSVTAANLALALAEGGRVKVLLVDGALKSPSQARLFGLGNEYGLTTLLAARENDPRSAIEVVRVAPGLFVLPAGPKVLSPHAVLGSEAAAHVLGAMRRVFRYIVVDAAPVFGTAETLAWHGMIDRYILVARAGKTTTEDLAKAADRVNREKILGVTFVGAPTKSLAV